ncbi:MAG: LysR family transcriptional regulator [Martelella sp.]|uniref:LysR family transcriptional regulator n=1 Tax=Martelella sp. TaxID=1969699 RepID=UPI003242B1D4
MHSTFMRYFDEVARQGSIRKAAAVLNVSSTTVNRKIIATEKTIGVLLLERTPEGVTLTDAGRIVLEHCRETLNGYERTKMMLDDIRDLRSGHINICAIDSVTYGLLPRILLDFNSVYPQITYSVTTAQPDDIMEAVASGICDIGITFTFDVHPGVRIISEKGAPIGIIMRPDHPLATRSSLSISDLDGLKLVRTVDARGRNSIIDQAFTGIAPSLSTNCFTDTLHVAKHMILAGRSLGVYTQIGFYDEIQQRRLCFVPLQQDVLLNLKIGVVMSAASGISPPERLLGNEIKRALAGLRLDAAAPGPS